MEAYKRWIRRNKECIHSLESLANGLTWLLPEQFSDSEVGPEAVTAVLGMVAAVNKHIINTIPTQIHAGSAEPSSFPYSLCITLLKDLETVIEVAAQQLLGDDKKWNVMVIIEAIKVCVRLALFQNSGYNMLLHGGEIANVEKGSEALNPQHKFEHFTKPGWHQGPGNLKNLEGRALSALSGFGENARMLSAPTWLRRVQHQHAMLEPPPSVVERPTLSSFLTKKGLRGALFLTGEVMFITRPLMYVMLIRKYGVRSWFPWCISLAIDLAGMAFFRMLQCYGIVGKTNRSIFLTLKRMS